MTPPKEQKGKPDEASSELADELEKLLDIHDDDDATTPLTKTPSLKTQQDDPIADEPQMPEGADPSLDETDVQDAPTDAGNAKPADTSFRDGGEAPSKTQTKSETEARGDIHAPIGKQPDVVDQEHDREQELPAASLSLDSEEPSVHPDEETDGSQTPRESSEEPAKGPVLKPLPPTATKTVSSAHPKDEPADLASAGSADLLVGAAAVNVARVVGTQAPDGTVDDNTVPPHNVEDRPSLEEQASAEPVLDVGIPDPGQEDGLAGPRLETTPEEVAQNAPPRTEVVTPAPANAASPAQQTQDGEVKRVPLPVGQVLRDRYELLEVIGLGGMSTVYRALDRFRVRARSPHAQVALKIVNVNEKIGNDAVELMHREARRMQELVHPNIVRVYDWDRDDSSNTDFIVMELLEGRTLAKALKATDDGTLAFPQILHLLTCVGAALHHAHMQDVVHTDIKPGNIFIERNGGIKVIDFGTARRLNPFPGGEDDPTVIYLDRVGALTPAYASLEMLRGEDPSPTDDVYGLGILTYMMIAGHHPFDKKSAEDALAAKMKPKKPKGLSGWRWKALSQAIQLVQDNRTATVEEFIEGFTKKPWWRIF